MKTLRFLVFAAMTIFALSSAMQASNSDSVRKARREKVQKNLTEEEKAVLKSKRQEVKGKVKAGEMTREQAKTEVKQTAKQLKQNRKKSN